MRYFVLLGMLSVAAYAVTALLTAAIVTLVWRMGDRSRSRAAGHSRAQRLAILRAAPFAIGAATSLSVAGIFLRFEPAATTESPSVTLVLAASLAMPMFGAALVRAFQAAAATRQCEGLLRTCGRQFARSDDLPLWIVDTPYPIAAVVGVVRPRLVLSGQILRECSSAEMQAILRHEAAHVRRRDNLFRAFMLAVPDPFQFGSAGRGIARAWAAAAEQAADDEAAGDRAEIRVHLASALVRVSRMAHGTPPAWAAGVAFFEGSNLEERVRRLLAPRAAGRHARVLASAITLLIAAAAVLVFADSTALRVRALMEAAVNLLP